MVIQDRNYIDLEEVRPDQECERHACRYGVLTDGHYFVSFAHSFGPNKYDWKQVRIKISKHIDTSMAKVLASMIFDEAYRSHTPFCREDLPDLRFSHPYRGAPNQHAMLH